MPLTLTLVQTSPATNPDRNIVKVGFAGSYVNGVGDLIPLAVIADPQVLVQVPLNDPTQAPPPATPSVWSEWLGGYNVQVQRVVTGVGLAQVTNFYLRMYAPGGAEFGSALYSTAIGNAILLGELMLEIMSPTVQQ